jgi:protein-S-isoprenylcysteine O-methyltransferase Ste14
MPIFNKIFQYFHALPLFDPSRLPHREILSRVCAIVLVLAFLYFKLLSFGEFPGTPDGLAGYFQQQNIRLGAAFFSGRDIHFIWSFKMAIWTLETGILAGYIFAYLFRAPAVSIARGFMEVAFPFIISTIPILISFAPYNFTDMVSYDSGFYMLSYSVSASLILTGGAINLTGLLTLKKAFAIMSEARLLVTIGIFKHVRHPLYLGHIIMFLGSLSMRLHVYTILLYACFVAGQVIRAYKEEEKLSSAFPEYEAYRQATPMFIPGRLFFNPNKPGEKISHDSRNTP